MQDLNPLYRICRRLAESAGRRTYFHPLSFLPGLLVLTPVDIVAQRTAQQGVSLLDSLILVPGGHLQSTANELHKGEYPACAALTTGYVFRVEDPATVDFLQQIGRTGHLTNLSVSTKLARPTPWKVISGLSNIAAFGISFWVAQLLYAKDDIWGVFFVSNLVVTRLIDSAILWRRTRPGWFGAPEPGVQGDLLILLSQDRWIRIRGAVDDLKVVTSGAWFREPTLLESFFGGFSKLLTYANVAIAGLTFPPSAIILGGTLLINSGLLALGNVGIRNLKMHGRVLEVVGEPKKYHRRRDLAEELIEETGRDDWAVAMAMIVKEKSEGIVATM